MFELLTNSRRASPLSMTPGVAASAFLHAAIIGVIVFEQVRHPEAAVEWTEAVDGLTYIAPPNKNSAASRVVVRYEAGGGASGDLVANSEKGDLRASGEGSGEAAVASASGGDDPEAVAPETDDPFEDSFSSVEVETAAERDPASAAPAYPPNLMSEGVEGYAAMRFVVDTTGRVDPASIRVLDTTHPEFAVAVRQAMPGMIFTPARLGDRPVRQLAEQLFRFQIIPSSAATVARPMEPATQSGPPMAKRP